MGQQGGERTSYPTNGAGNGHGIDGIREKSAGYPTTTRGNKTGTPRGDRGTLTDQGVADRQV